MSARILDGKWLAGLVQKDIRAQVDRYTAEGKRRPGLGVVLVGENPASKTYVKNKERFAHTSGFETFDISLPASVSEGEVLDAVDSFNANPGVDGILVQLPLPKHIRSSVVLDRISPSKDADGLHPFNQGLLMRDCTGILPCTPQGSMNLIDLSMSEKTQEISEFSQIKREDLSGMRAAVVGRSILVGKPLALMLLERNATVSVVHSRTQRPDQICREADILVAAVGVPKLVTAEWVKPGAIVIDVGINRLDSGALVGDVDFASVEQIASAITPVPGGVGPMTVAMLIRNTLYAYEGRM